MAHCNEMDVNLRGFALGLSNVVTRLPGESRVGCYLRIAKRLKIETSGCHGNKLWAVAWMLKSHVTLLYIVSYTSCSTYM